MRMLDCGMRNNGMCAAEFTDHAIQCWRPDSQRSSRPARRICGSTKRSIGRPDGDYADAGQLPWLRCELCSGAVSVLWKGTGCVMGVCYRGDCRKCHRFSELAGPNRDQAFCGRCVNREAMQIMGRNYFCTSCNDFGHHGFLDPDGWLAGEIGDCHWLQWLIKRECPKCHGDPASQLPTRPYISTRDIMENAKSFVESRPTLPPPPRPRTKHDEFNKLMAMCYVSPGREKAK